MPWEAWVRRLAPPISSTVTIYRVVPVDAVTRVRSTVPELTITNGVGSVSFGSLVPTRTSGDAGAKFH
jgi:hypothetical protein